MGSVWAETGIGRLWRTREREEKGAEMKKGGENEREKIN